VLSEFKQTQYGYGIEIEVQLGKIKGWGEWGSVGDAKEVKLIFRHLHSKDETLHTFIHEFIHIVRFEEGCNMYDSSIEDERVMLEVAEEHLSETAIFNIEREVKTRNAHSS